MSSPHPGRNHSAYSRGELLDTHHSIPAGPLFFPCLLTTGTPGPCQFHLRNICPSHANRQSFSRSRCRGYRPLFTPITQIQNKNGLLMYQHSVSQCYSQQRRRRTTGQRYFRKIERISIPERLIFRGFTECFRIFDDMRPNLQPTFS